MSMTRKMFCNVVRRDRRPFGLPWPLLQRLCALALLGVCDMANAQAVGSFDIAGATQAGGGGRSIGGAFALDGTIGQTAASPMSGGEFGILSGFTATCPPDCDVGDLDCDGSINGADLGIILLEFGPCATPHYCLSDLDGNGEVDGGDIAIMLLIWN
jgi:hypothetical protein